MTIRSTFFLSTFALVIAACGEESSEEEVQPTEWSDPDGVEVTWKPARPDGLNWELKASTTYVKAPDSDLVTVTETSLRVPAADFPELLNLELGSAIIGNPHQTFAATNPIGFIRKVAAVSQDGDEIVIETEAASLADAFESCDMVTTIKLDDFENLEFVAEDGAKISPKAPSGDPEANPALAFNKSGTVLFQNDQLKATLSKATFQFAPSFNFDLDASLLKGLKRLSAVASGSQSAELEVKLENTVGVDEEFEKTFSAAPIPIPLGPIVITVTPKLVLGCSVQIPEGMNLTAGMQQSSSVAFGVEFVKGEGLSPIAQSSFSFTRLGPTFNTGKPITARCFIRPELQTGLNIVVANAGIDIGLEGYAQVSAAVTNNVCKVDMDLGVGITAGVSATAFGFDVLDEDVTLFSKEVALLDNASCIPKLKNTATPN